VHRHLFYKSKTKTNPKTKTKSKSKSLKRNKIQRVAKKEINLTPLIEVNEKPQITTSKGISPHVNKKILLDAIHNIQQCLDVEQCTEIKNYITVNVCDVNSSDKDILFYLSYLPQSEQKSIYDKVTNFSNTLV
jgi:hypothetical protein